MTAQNTTVTIEGKKYNIEALSDKAKNLIVIHQKWTNELQESRLEVAKTEAALRDLAKELVAIVAEEPNALVDEEAPVAKSTKKKK